MADSEKDRHAVVAVALLFRKESSTQYGFNTQGWKRL